MNITANGSSCSILFNPTAAKIGATVAHCLIFVFSLVGNSLIGIVVSKTQTLRKPINYFIVNMAMSDLLYPIFSFPWNLTQLYSNKSWLISGPLGVALCKLSPFLAEGSTTVSIQSLVLVAVDRFGAVVFPLRSPLISSKLCPYFVLATWIVAMAFLSPYLFAFKLDEYEGELFCDNLWNEVFGESSSPAHYFLAGYVVFFYIPLALLAVLYSIILIKLKTQKIPGEQSTNSEQQRAKRNRNVLKLAIAILLGFALCWVPWSIIALLLFLGSDITSACSFFIYYDIAWFMALSNCAINPWICVIFSSNYKRALKRLLKCSSGANQQ